MKILIAAGGSGGHIFPAIALARALRQKANDAELLFVGSDKALDKRIFEKEGVRFMLLSANKLPYKASLRLIGFFALLALDTVRSFFLLLRFRPDAVVGFGGYVSFPVLLTAGVFRIPRIVHEQNVVPGRANRALFGMADRVAISFEATKRHLGPAAAIAVYTGNPVRRELFRDERASDARRLGLDPAKFTILVIGGSQGAHHLNETFVTALDRLEGDRRRAMQVIHITGVKDYEWAARRYGELGIDHRVYSFVDRIEEAYSAADLVVTRSGASALFELALLGKAMILVPYPHAMSHQKENARAFSEKGGAIEIDEKDLSADMFKKRITDLCADRDALARLGDAARKLGVPDASERLASEVLNLTER